MCFQSRGVAEDDNVLFLLAWIRLIWVTKSGPMSGRWSFAWILMPEDNAIGLLSDEPCQNLAQAV